MRELSLGLQADPSLFFLPIALKVHIFWEGHKILRNLHLNFVYSTNVSTDKSKMEISQNFVAFSEYMNFRIWDTKKTFWN